MGAVRAYIDFCQRFAWPIVALVVAVSLGALALASQLAIEADMARLLPKSAPSVAGLERLEEAYGGQIGRLTVVLESQPTGERRNPKLERTAHTLADRLEDLGGVDRVEATKPIGFFENRRLLYADLDDLQTIQHRLDRRIRWEKKRANPLFVDVEDGEPPEVDFSDLTEKVEEFDGSAHYLSADGSMLALFVYPSFAASDLGRAEKLVEQVDGIVQRELKGQVDVGYGLTGRYKKRVDLQEMLQRDLAVSMSLALGLILIFLFAFLRSAHGTAAVIAPLIVGTILTFAWAELAFGSLNILTAFLGAVLMGLGVDYGIHLYSRFHELSEECHCCDALAETLATTGRANLFAGLTTMVALGSLVVSEFRAFFEFGVIALGGLVLILVSYAVLFPCTVLLASRYDFDLPPPASRALTERVLAKLEVGGDAAVNRRAQAAGRAATAALVAVVVAASVGLPQLDFVRDFSVLQSTSAPSWKLDEKVNEMLGQSQTPAVVLADSERQAETIVGELRQRASRLPEGYTIDKVVSLSTFVPERQRAKLEVIRQIARTLADLPSSARPDEFARYLEEVRRVSSLGELSIADLPEQVRRPFSRKDAPDKAVVLVFPAINLSDMDAVDDYARVIRSLPGVDSGRGYDAISDALLLSDIIRMAERDAVWMLAITLIGLLLLSLVAFRSRRLVGLQLLVVALAVLVALGLNGLLGVDFNFMNVVILPIWIGLGVDASFHIMLHVDNGHKLGPHSNVALAISAAYLTSMIGFGTLLLARHTGLLSLGQVAVIGLGSILTINLLVQVMLVARQRENIHS
ncbi:efflux RND transporter permease subunit [Persicimonas caeni]|nr:MMPL family transporter [Persicimonas caeni]